MSILHCPFCGFSYLHHGGVEVFNREFEDSEKGSHTYVSGNGGITYSHLGPMVPGNPSPRRDGVLIRFTCEACDDPLVLAIYQHKGQTYVEWKGRVADQAVQIHD